MEWSVYAFWDSLGVARQRSIPSFWLVQLGWETPLKCMEFGAGVRDVVSKEGCYVLVLTLGICNIG